jgi:transposase
MLRVEEVHVLRHQVLVEGRSQRQVARELGISRNTVRRYLTIAEPVRIERAPRARPVFERVRPRLDELIEQWSQRTTPKQRLTATRLHRELREEGYAVGVTLVRDHLREWRRRQAEVYVPLVHRAGEEAQVDFFEVTVELGGERRKAWKFLMRLMYSGRDFAWLYERCDQLAFLDGHVRAFAHFGGVPERGVYDNLKPAVRRVLFPRRQLTARFEALASHYLFEPCFARPGEGHDKGGVEARGQAIRLQHLTPIPRGDSLGELSAWLLSEVERHAPARVWEHFAEEQRLLRPLPDVAFDVRRVRAVSVSRSALVRVEGAWYSVPSGWAGLRATAYVGVEEVELRCRDERVVHPRQPFGGRLVRYRHYLGELARKPQAVRQVAPELVAELGEPFERLWGLLVPEQGAHDAARTLARLLRAVQEHGEQRVREVLERVLEEAPAAGNFDELAVQRLLVAAAPPAEVAVPPRLQAYEVESASAAAYDDLLGAVAP